MPPAPSMASRCAPSCSTAAAVGMAIVDGQLVDLYLLVDNYAERASLRFHALAESAASRPTSTISRLPTPEARVRAKYALVSLGNLSEGSHPIRSIPISGPASRSRQACSGRAIGRRAAGAGALTQAIRTTARCRPVHLSGVGGRGCTLDAGPERKLSDRAPRRETRAGASNRQRRPGALSAGDGGFGTAVAVQSSPASARRRWLWRRIQGKGLSLLRLAKASFTFAGGADYLAWKISRHAGVPVEFRPWERRHPMLAAPWILWRLTRRGIVR